MACTNVYIFYIIVLLLLGYYIYTKSVREGFYVQQNAIWRQPYMFKTPKFVRTVNPNAGCAACF